MTMVIIILIILLITAYFYLKCSVISSLSTLILAVLATLVAMSYYEILAELFVSRGYGVQWAHSGCYTLAFILSFALFRALRDLMIGGTKMELGEPLKIVAAIVCGVATGAIACGNLLIAVGLSPAHNKMLYSRFDPAGKVSIKAPKKSFLNTDGFVSGLYSTASRGAMASKKSFAVLHTDYLTQLHLNRLQTKDGVTAVTSRKSLQIPSGKKKPVRIFDIDDVGKVTVVRMGLVAKNIQDGGAGNPAENGKIEFFPAQIRVICKPDGDTLGSTKGSGTAYYPIGLIVDGGKYIKADLKERINPEIPKNKNHPIWLDVAFDIPQGNRPTFLQFKQNAIVELPDAVPTSDEIEQALNAADDEEKKEENPEG